jgi:hypothetical protein
MLSVLVDHDGCSWPTNSFAIAGQRPTLCPAADTIHYAVHRLGFVHIRRLGERSLIVKLRPELVSRAAMIEALFAIADLRPDIVFIFHQPGDWKVAEPLPLPRALNRIDQLVSGAQGIALPSGGSENDSAVTRLG